MPVTVAKWGNSLAVRIPARTAEQVWLTAGRGVVFDIQDGNIVLHPVTNNKNGGDIEILIAQITPENKHDAVSSWTLVGKENVLW